MLSKEHGAVFRTRQQLLERKCHRQFDLNCFHVTAMLHPRCAFRQAGLSSRDQLIRSTNGKIAPWRLRQGWIVESSESQAPGAGRSSPSFLHKIGAGRRAVLIGNRGLAREEERLGGGWEKRG
jgi:hypothetical protein